MASAWGDSWGVAWGVAWGATDSAESSGPLYGRGNVPRRRRPEIIYVDQPEPEKKKKRRIVLRYNDGVKAILSRFKK